MIVSYTRKKELGFDHIETATITTVILAFQTDLTSRYKRHENVFAHLHTAFKLNFQRKT